MAKKKFDTNPLDPDFPKKAAFAEPAPQETKTLPENGAKATQLFEEPVVTDEAETPAEDEEVPEGRITDEQLADLTAAYNNVAVPYNEIATAVNENGWMNDEQTAAEMKALSDTLGFIGKGLTEDISLLDGSDFDALIDYLENEFPPALEELSERVSVPYEAG